MEYARNAVQFFTAVCNDWQKLLEADVYKQIVIDALLTDIDLNGTGYSIHSGVSRFGDSTRKDHIEEF
ncbi:MAG: hypothetical protein U5K54_12700 [Cytophagales bacterium]|nr:hypothetical protein [Cytophagales bacterium]